MNYFSEFIVVYEDCAMPEEETLCPSLWKLDSVDFGKSCDYFFDNIEGRWTNLEIIDYLCGNNIRTIFTVNAYYETNPNYDSNAGNLGILQKTASSVEREFLGSIKNLAVAALAIETSQSDIYKEYITSVWWFLKHTKGFVVNTPISTANFSKAHFSYLNPDDFFNRYLNNA